MGYDMYVCDEDGKTLHGDEFYCRRNMWNQGNLRLALLRCNMAFEAVGEDNWRQVPERPDDNHWVTSEDGWSREPVTQEARDFVAAVDRYYRDSRDERPGIPIHKLIGNDGWWVTKVECQSALKLFEMELASNFYADNTDQSIEEQLVDFVPFLEAAAKHGGFRVY